MENNIKTTIKGMQQQYFDEYGVQPLWAECIIVFNGGKMPTGEIKGGVCVLQDPNNPAFELQANEEVVMVQLDTDVDEDIDDRIFFYFNGIEDLLNYCEPNPKHDFYITRVNVFYDAI